MKNIADYRRLLQTRFNTLSALCTADTDVWQEWQLAEIVEEAQIQGTRYGLDLVAPEAASLTPRAAVAIIGKLLAAVGNVPSKFLDSAGACDYLGITEQSLYGLVERKRLTPLRGPRRSYRFTPQQLDQYLENSAA